MSDRTIITLGMVGAAIICWALAVLFFVIRSNAQKKIALQKRVCVNVTNATVIKMVQRRIDRSDVRSYTWHPTYEYYVNGVRYVEERKSGSEKKLFEEGQQIEIRYNPNNPEDVYVPAEQQEKGLTKFTVLAVGFFASGFLAIGMLILFLAFIFV